MKKYNIDKTKLVGTGGYSKVYEATSYYENENSPKLVVKSIEDSDIGIQSPIELLIMKSYRNDLIATSVDIEKYNKELYIYIKKYKGSLYDIANRIDRRLSFRYLFILAKALFSLHKENIIHADLKLENILYDENMNIVLTDFSLSRFVTEYTSLPLCTVRYRPPEAYLKYKTDTKVDIWSLGCLFYKLLYGVYLFPNQYRVNPSEVKNDYERMLLHEEEKMRTLCCINDWNMKFYNNSYPINTSNFNIKDYYPLNIHTSFLEDKEAFYLIHKMLHPDPKKRISVIDLLEFFITDVNKLVIPRPSKIKIHIDNNLNSIENQKYRYYVRRLELKIKDSPLFRKIAYRVLLTIPDIIAIKDEKIKLTLFICHKLCGISIPNNYFNINKYSKLEESYYEYNNYRLI